MKATIYDALISEVIRHDFDIHTGYDFDEYPGVLKHEQDGKFELVFSSDEKKYEAEINYTFMENIFNEDIEFKVSEINVFTMHDEKLTIEDYQLQHISNLIEFKYVCH